MKTGFSHFFEFGTSDGLDIVYYDRIKCFPAFDNITRSWRIIQMSQKCIFEWSKEPKKRFVAIFWSLVCWIDLILHNVIVLNVFQHLTLVSFYIFSLVRWFSMTMDQHWSQKQSWASLFCILTTSICVKTLLFLVLTGLEQLRLHTQTKFNLVQVLA